MKLDITKFNKTNRNYEKMRIRHNLERREYLAGLKREVIMERAAGKGSINTDAVKILTQMGYKKSEAEEKIKGLAGDTQEIVREALKRKGR